MTGLISVELRKQLGRPRTILTLAALLAFDLALTVSLAFLGPALERVGDLPMFMVAQQSGWTVPVIVLASTMKFFLPLAVAVFAGEAVAGEASWGSLRYALAGPVSRSRYLLAKLVVATGLSALVVVAVPLVALILGTVCFGWRPLLIVDGATSTALTTVTVQLDQSVLSLRMGLSVLYVLAGMGSIFAFSFFLSTLTARPLLAVAGGVALTLLSRVLNADYLPGVAAISPYLPNNDIDLWQHLFQEPARTAGMARFLVLQLVYVLVFLGLAWLRFRTKDVLD